MGAAIYQNKQRINLEKLQNLNNYLLELTEQYFSNVIVKENMLSDIVVSILFKKNGKYALILFFVIRN